MPPITPRFPPWFTGDLVSASKLNDMMDWIDTATGLHEQRVYPFDAGANVLDCDVYGRPTYGYNHGSQVEYWLAHNGDTLVISLAGTDPAYLYWNWDGVTLTNADAVIPANTVTTLPLTAAQLSGLYQYQPVRVMLRSTYHPNNSIFVNYLYQTDSNAPATLGTMPAFTNGTASSANDLNLIQSETETALDCLSQPVPCQYSNNDRVGTRNYWNGYIRHTHTRLLIDLTVSVEAFTPGRDYAYINFNGQAVWTWAPSESNLSFDGIADNGINLGAFTFDPPLVVGNWYNMQIGFNRQAENEQHVTVWSCAAVPGDALANFNSMSRWDHGDVLNGSTGGPPYLAQMSDALGDISGVLRWVNQPCRTAGSIKLDINQLDCTGEQIIDGMSAYRVHRWLAYNTFRKSGGDYATATLQWFTSGRNLQSYSLPLIDASTGYGFFDMESTPVKPGMWFRLVNAGFGIQTPTPGTNYV